MRWPWYAHRWTSSHGLAHGTDARGVQRGGPVPTFTLNPDGSRGQSRRFCTDQWKLRPIRREIRRRLGVNPGRRVPAGTEVSVLIGFSVDEISRMKDPPGGWEVPSYPLIDAGLSRSDCAEWWSVNAPATAPPLGRSACVICPFHSSSEWRRNVRDNPEMITAAAAAEASGQEQQDRCGYGHILHFLHPRRIPLLDALDADAAQGTLFDADTDCGGICFT